MTYDTFKLQVFAVHDLITTRTLIEQDLHRLSKQFNIPYNKVVEDYNIYNCYDWDIQYEKE